MGDATHRIEVEHIGYNAKGMLWRVTHEGGVILEKTRLPALDACRYLLALGKTGNLVMFRNGELQLTVDIVKGAGLTVVEAPTKGPVFGVHQPYTCEGEEEVEPAVIGIG
jgi:hypothetical protein